MQKFTFHKNGSIFQAGEMVTCQDEKPWHKTIRTKKYILVIMPTKSQKVQILRESRETGEEKRFYTVPAKLGQKIEEVIRL